MDYKDLHEYFTYNPQTGLFERIKTVRGSRLGKVGTLDSNGYISIPFRMKRYLAHRLAWLYMNGEWPNECIDHINGIRNDNRFSNLREATNAENHQNLKKPRTNNNSGYLGVSKATDRNKWAAKIKHMGKLIHIGYFNTPEEAHKAYVYKKREIHTHGTL